ncbi:MAG: hypothetical protein GY797_18220 [Deltaproteobacteria bacterium]|nr:hypothetical protein [Deltaproteobacteria bacterium]
MDTIASLLTPSSEESSKIVTVVSQVGNTTYSVIDRKQRKYIAEAADTYLPGQSVVVKKGIIIGKTKSTQTYKEFNI